LKRGDTRATFHLFEKRPFVMDMLNNLVRGSENTGEICFNTLTLIPSGPVAFDRDNL
jgi:hypothetical protein